MAYLQPYVGDEWRLQPYVVECHTTYVHTDPVIVHEDSAPVFALGLAWLGLGPGLELRLGYLGLGLGLGLGLQG